MLDASKGAWVDKLPMCYGQFALPIELQQNSFLYGLRCKSHKFSKNRAISPDCLYFDETWNVEIQWCELDFFDERKDDSKVKLASYQQKIARCYNIRVKKKSFQRDDLVLKRVFLFSNEPVICTLGPNWEGSYHISDELRSGTFRIENLEGNVQPHSWNI